MARPIAMMTADDAPAIQTVGSGLKIEFVGGGVGGEGACEGVRVCGGWGVGDGCGVGVGFGAGDCWGAGEG